MALLKHRFSSGVWQPASSSPPQSNSHFKGYYGQIRLRMTLSLHTRRASDLAQKAGIPLHETGTVLARLVGLLKHEFPRSVL